MTEPEAPRRPRLAALLAARRTWRVLFGGYAVLLATLTHWPSLRVEAPIERPDLLVHVAAFGLWTVLLGLTRLLGPVGAVRSTLLTGGLALVVAALDEATQALPALGRQPDPSDLAANLLGVGAGAATLVAAGRLLPRAAPPAARAERNFTGHARTFAGLTLVSRVLGLARDAVIAAVLGAGPVSSAIFAAFVVPNLFRRLFGEGALSAAFLPEYTRLVRDDPAEAARLASLTVAASGVLVGGIVLLGEIGLAAALATDLVTAAPARLALLLAMLMLPFAPLVCATAILGGMLQVHGRFAPHAGAPIALNLALLSTTASAAWILGLPPRTIAIAMAGAVVVAGLFQFLWCLAELRGRAGWTRRCAAAAPRVRRLGARMLPVLLGLGAMQLGLLVDTLLAGAPLAGDAVAALGLPVDAASASVLYFAQRIQQLPLGVFTVAIATAVFPALARAASDAEFGATLGRGLRVSAFIGLPAAAGLVAVREPLVRTLYGGGAFTDDDARRVAAAVLAYAPLVAAASWTPVLVRACYARDEMRLPTRVGLVAVALNVVASIALVWPLAEAGLALASSIVAIVQLALLLRAAPGRLAREPGTRLRLLDGPGWSSVATSALASLAMAGLVAAALALAPPIDDGRLGAGIDLAIGVAIGAGSYLALAVALRRPELHWLLRG